MPFVLIRRAWGRRGSIWMSVSNCDTGSQLWLCPRTVNWIVVGQTKMQGVRPGANFSAARARLAGCTGKHTTAAGQQCRHAWALSSQLWGQVGHAFEGENSQRRGFALERQRFQWLTVEVPRDALVHGLGHVNLVIHGPSQQTGCCIDSIAQCVELPPPARLANLGDK